MRTFSTADFMEHETHRFVAFASDLNFPPACPLAEFKIEGLGNGMPLRLQKSTPQEFVYEQTFGCVRVTVFNT